MDYFKDFMKLHIATKLFSFLLFIVNALFPLLLFYNWQAQATLGCYLGSLAIQLIVYKRVGFTRLVKLGRLLWLPLLFVVLQNTILVNLDPASSAWIMTLLVVNISSLVIDLRDLKLWVSGQRESLVG